MTGYPDILNCTKLWIRKKIPKASDRRHRFLSIPRPTITHQICSRTVLRLEDDRQSHREAIVPCLCIRRTSIDARFKTLTISPVSRVVFCRHNVSGG